MKDYILDIQSLSKSFTNEPALKPLDFKIKSGKMTGLIGPDGAGKTTLIRIIVGLISASNGKLTYNFRNLADNKNCESDDNLEFKASPNNDTKFNHQIKPKNKPAASKSSVTLNYDSAAFDHDNLLTIRKIHNSIGYMPQKFGLYEDLSVIENLNLYADLRQIYGNQRQERYEKLLKFTDLARFKERLAGNLSGGMKQKLGLACTLIGEPELLILDEPSVGVDPISRRELWQMVSELSATGMSVIWSTAYLDEAEKCTEVLLLNDGQALYSGLPADILNRVKGRVHLLDDFKDNLKPRTLLLENLKDGLSTDAVIQGKSLKFVFKKDQLDTALNKYKNLGTLSQTPANFEDAFLDTLGGIPEYTSKLAEIITPKEFDEKVIVEADSLTKIFGDFTAVKDNSFIIKRGEIFGLLGPNGAGKSTTFKMMCGLITPTEGTTAISGISFAKSASAARAKLGYMAQKFSLYGNLTLLENLEFYSGIYGLTGKKQSEQIKLMQEVFKFDSYKNTKASTLPLGFKQRLALACSVMHEPDVLFLDEPTSGVDPITRREFWLHINSLVAKGVTVLVTTHFMDEAEYCDRIGLIYRGENIATGSPTDLKTKIKTSTNLNPTLEETFIELIKKAEHTNA
jgi:ABC-2 type transport system ATP-binding protein